MCASRSEIVARPACGPLRGEVDGPTAVFRGIRYALPAAGPWRWRAPRPVPPWREVRDATAWPPDCPQPPLPTSRADGQDEDCLALNVWTPAGAVGATSGAAGLPVLVWLYGGGFTGGSVSDATFDGAALSRQGIVVVNAAYRVGVLGFLAHPALSGESEHHVSGNYGLLDAIEALEWVREHIAAFGGDPARVTLAGVSAGSAMVSLLLASPRAEGLFHRAILHSPGAFRPLCTLRDAEAAGRTLGDDIAWLRAQPASAMVAANERMNPKIRGLTTPRPLRPICDGWLVREEERLAFSHGRFSPMPTLVGHCVDEGSAFVGGWPFRTVADYRAHLLASFGERHFARAERCYPVAGDADVPAALANLFGDTQFVWGARALARAMWRREPRTWRWVFTRRRAGVGPVPRHGDDPAYLFGTLQVPRKGVEMPFDDRDRAMSAMVMRMWARFAASGDPNGEGDATWPSCGADGDAHLELGDDIVRGDGWRTEALDFLDDYFELPAHAVR